MLTEVTRPDGKKVALTYDPLGRRVSKSLDGVETRWVWSGNTVLHETKTGQAGVTWYHDPDGLAPLAKVVGDQTFVVVTDHLGMPTAMYDGAGKLAWRMQLDLFGVPKVGSSGDGEECNWRWPGQYEDREIGLYYNRFRYYDPTLGQYISQDPIGLSGGLALYSYTPDPLFWIDPLGLAGSCGSNTRDPKALYRYFGEGEARVIRDTGRIPNFDADDLQKTVYLSSRFYKTAGRAKTHLQLPTRPTYRVKVAPADIPSRTPLARVEPQAHPEWGMGGGTEAMTSNTVSVNVSNIVRLKGG
jgi:RHS repeat-associated protein